MKLSNLQKNVNIKVCSLEKALNTNGKKQIIASGKHWNTTLSNFGEVREGFFLHKNIIPIHYLEGDVLQIKALCRKIAKIDSIVLSDDKNVIIEVVQTLYSFGRSGEDITVYVQEISEDTLSLLSLMIQCRDYVNTPFNIMHTSVLAEEMIRVASNYKEVSINKISNEEILEKGMRCLWNVGNTSEHGTHFVVLSYNGDKSVDTYDAIIGKGVTFDTGGINLKSSSSMYGMHTDMAGAATAFATFMHCVICSFKRNIVVGLPLCENSIGKGLRPGDIIESFGGTKIEVENTDAEGRLILIDAAEYIEKHFNVSRMFVLATLTGIAEKTFGPECAPFCCNSAEIIKEIKRLSHKNGELFVHLEHHKEYEHCIESRIADIKNVGGKYGDIYSGALFIKRGIKSKEWFHIDIAGTAYNTEKHPRIVDAATAFGIRTLSDILVNHIGNEHE